MFKALYANYIRILESYININIGIGDAVMRGLGEGKGKSKGKSKGKGKGVMRCVGKLRVGEGE